MEICWVKTSLFGLWPQESSLVLPNFDRIRHDDTVKARFFVLSLAHVLMLGKGCRISEPHFVLSSFKFNNVL